MVPSAQRAIMHENKGKYSRQKKPKKASRLTNLNQARYMHTMHLEQAF